MCVCVCVCVRERERECVRACVWKGGRKHGRIAKWMCGWMEG